MFQALRQFLSIDRIAGYPRPSNRTTPSRNRHINSLPTEILIMIFQNYCGPRYNSRYGLISLTLVCRFWHAIVNACPALWTSITFQRRDQPFYNYRFNECSISCNNWSNLERALTRARTATLELGFYLGGELHSHDEDERVLRLFGRCHDLAIALETGDEYTFSSSIIMPHLERLDLFIDEHAHIQPLLDSIESSSPLLRSLSIHDNFPANLARREPLLRRLVQLDLRSPPDDNISFFCGLQNLEELKIHFLPGMAINLSPSDLPKLLSLYIRATPLSTNQQPITFPALESLTLDGKWSNLQFIDAPNLRNIVLLYRDGEEPEGVTMSALQRSTVRPLSLSTDFISDTYLPKLLELWSSLSELHLRGWTSACIPGPITTAALAGNDDAAPLCSSLRYFTVHMKQGRKNTRLANMSTQRLKRIIKKRKNYGAVGLQRVMCVWDWDNYWHTSEVEWVDVL